MNILLEVVSRGSCNLSMASQSSWYFMWRSSGNQRVEPHCQIQLISVAFEHSMLCIREIYALENVVFYIAVYGPYKLYFPYTQHAMFKHNWNQLYGVHSKVKCFVHWDGKFMLCKMWCFTLQFMARTNHIFPLCTTRSQLTVHLNIPCFVHGMQNLCFVKCGVLHYSIWPVQTVYATRNVWMHLKSTVIHNAACSV